MFSLFKKKQNQNLEDEKLLDELEKLSHRCIFDASLQGKRVKLREKILQKMQGKNK